MRLLAPARVSFGDGVVVDRLRIGLQQAVLDLAGRVTPTLNLTASLRGVTPDLAKPFAPDVDAAGEISADAKLTGTTGRTIRQGAADRNRPAHAHRAGPRIAAGEPHRDGPTRRQIRHGGRTPGCGTVQPGGGNGRVPLGAGAHWRYGRPAASI